MLKNTTTNTIVIFIFIHYCIGMYDSNIGKICDHCKKHDYLPIYCNKCKKYHCNNHSGDRHVCVGLDDAVKILPRKKMKKKVKKKKSVSFKCEFCKKGVAKTYMCVCKYCKKNFCITHRLFMEHNCEASKEMRKGIDKKIEQRRRANDNVHTQNPQISQVTKGKSKRCAVM